jgi:hypothetical protein
MTYLPGQFAQIDVLKANRWLKDVLDRHGIRRVTIGSVDLGWEKRRSSRYLQLHWHLAMWTTNPVGLAAKLKAIFRTAHKFARPIDVKITRDLGFLGHKDKIVKLPKLLRHARRQLAEPEAGREPAVGSEGLPKIGVHWDQPAAAVLGCNIAQLDHRSDVTGWTDHHDPRQVGDLTGP